MNDEKIFKISILTTIIGLFALFFLSGYVNPEHVSINSIDKSKIDNNVELEATVESVTVTKSKTMIIKLYDDTGSINLVVFPSTELYSDNLEKSMKIKVIARVTQYNGDLELILGEANNLIVL